jgi:membrane-bound lytic murein transglycosylase A
MSGSSVTLDPVPFAAVPGWADDDVCDALPAYLNSAAGRGLPVLVPRQPARAFFETLFEACRVLHGAPAGLVTGYFEPELAGSRKRHGPYHVPVYRRPANLVNVVDEAERARASAASAYSHLRSTPEGLVPYYTRRDIESGQLAGQGLEICWLADAVEAFILHVQGSGRIRLDDGSVVRLAYAGKNGHPYTSVGRILIDRGIMPADGLTLDTMAAWLRRDGDRGRAMMQNNASFVFFRELKDDEPGPCGVDGIPLTAGRSLAVDPSFHPIGGPVFVVAPNLRVEGREFRRLMVAQDVGSAIRGPERGDIFFGGGDDARALAGSTKHAANFFVLRPRGGS